MRRKGINNVPVSIKVVQVLKAQGFNLPPFFLTYDEHSGAFSFLDTKHQFADRVWGANGFAGNASPTSRLRRPPGEFKSLSESLMHSGNRTTGSGPSSRSSSPTPILVLPTSLRSDSPPQLSQTPPANGSLSPLPKLATIPSTNFYDCSDRNDRSETNNRWAKYSSHYQVSSGSNKNH